MTRRFIADVKVGAGLACEINAALDLGIKIAQLYKSESAEMLIKETANKFDEVVRDADEAYERSRHKFPPGGGVAIQTPNTDALGGPFPDEE